MRLWRSPKRAVPCANNLRIVAEILQSTPRLIANEQAHADPWKREKLENVALMLKSCLNAEGRVGLMMNVHRDNLDRVLALLPALQNPTISSLSDPDWLDVNTIVQESLVRAVAPKLRAAGAGHCRVRHQQDHRLIGDDRSVSALRTRRWTMQDGRTGSRTDFQASGPSRMVCPGVSGRTRKSALRSNRGRVGLGSPPYGP